MFLTVLILSGLPFTKTFALDKMTNSIPPAFITTQDINHCWLKFRRDSQIKGRLTVTWTLSRQGKIKKLSLFSDASGPLENKALSNCVEKLAQSINWGVDDAERTISANFEIKTQRPN